MAPFRPANLNKRLVSPTGGNGGVIGPTKTPYCVSGTCCATIQLGSRYYGGGGQCCGIFKLGESFCGRKECCQSSPIDCGGYFYCCGPSTCKWFVAPACTELYGTLRQDATNCFQCACSCADALVGACGWTNGDSEYRFTAAELYNAYLCRAYWDSYQLQFYGGHRNGSYVCGTDFLTGTQSCRHKPNGVGRVFRCTLI